MRLLILAASLLATLPASAQEPTPFTCDGAFGPDTTHERLSAEFGADSVGFGEIAGDEGTYPLASVIFPNDPARRVALIWHDAEKREGAHYAFIAPDSGWTVHGIRTGMSVAEVEALNGKTFKLGGFNDMEHGQVEDWDGGELSSELGECRLTVAFGHPYLGTPLWLDDPLSSEGPYASDDPAYRALGARVTEITVWYPEQD